uniref:NR LBD domain-containing protein n=1 Tax=Ditylenchus dipsaci TaxID=166011 RepID=A0A915DXZ6_9BILA
MPSMQIRQMHFNGMNVMCVKLPADVNIKKLSMESEAKRLQLLQKFNLKRRLDTKENLDCKLLQHLLLVESKLKDVRENAVCFAASFSRSSVKDLILSTDNMLAIANDYSEPPSEFRFKFVYLQLGVLLSIEMAKTLPVFPKLSYKSQELMVRRMSLVNTILFDGYYSYELHQKVITFPNGKIFVDAARSSDVSDSPFKLIREYKKNFNYSIMRPIWRMGLSKEEMVLLKAIIYSNSNDKQHAVQRAVNVNWPWLLVLHKEEISSLSSSSQLVKQQSIASVCPPSQRFSQPSAP